MELLSAVTDVVQSIGLLALVGWIVIHERNHK